MLKPRDDAVHRGVENRRGELLEGDAVAQARRVEERAGIWLPRSWAGAGDPVAASAATGI